MKRFFQVGSSPQGAKDETLAGARCENMSIPDDIPVLDAHSRPDVDALFSDHSVMPASELDTETRNCLKDSFDFLSK